MLLSLIIGGLVALSAAAALITTVTVMAISDITYNSYLTKQSKLNVPSKSITILGASDLVFHEITTDQYGLQKSRDALSGTVDFVTYNDRAVVKQLNERGFDVYLTAAWINGKLIQQYMGDNGELICDDLKRDDDIRKNGETVMEIGNEFIIDADQVLSIADYWFKWTGTKKHLYVCTIAGTAAWYEVGAWYNLKIGSADHNEYIDSVVECYEVSCEREAGGIGTTKILFREVLENFAKTTFYQARAIAGGSAKRRINRSNVITVGAIDYSGTCDYRCDGVADNVEIQEAMDYISGSFGGGEIDLTAGNFVIAATLNIPASIKLIGAGANTVLKPYDASVTTVINFGTSANSEISYFTIDGDGSNITFVTNNMYIVDGDAVGNASNVNITNYVFSCTSGSKYFNLFYNLKTVNKCNSISNTMANTGTAGYLRPFRSCTNVLSCSGSGNSTSGSLAHLHLFSACTNVSSCSSTSNTTSGANAYLISFSACTNVSSCSSTSNTTSGIAAYNYSFSACTNVSSCSGSGNSTPGLNADVNSFSACTNVSSCSSTSNTTSGANASVNSFIACIRLSVSYTNANVSSLSYEYGFVSCTSVQQCKSTGDSVPYLTSYADSGTANACADTYQGGFNSYA